jgi:hypothetical protein
MSKLSRFVSYGIEEGTEIPPFDAMVDDSVSDETAVAEAVEKEGEVNEIASDVDEMSDVAESLEAICAGIQSTLRFGGMNRQAAAFALQSADMQMARLGLEGLAVSVEDFAEPEELVDAENKTSVEPDAASVVGSDEAGIAEDDNVDADEAGEVAEVVTSEDPEVAENLAVTQEAMEGIKNTLKTIWQAIVNAIKKMSNAIKGWWKKVTDWSPRIVKRCEALEETRKAKSLKAGDFKVKGGFIGNVFGNNAKTNVSTVSKELNILGINVEGYNSRATSMVSIVASAMVIASTKNDIEKASAELKKAVNAMPTIDLQKLDPAKGGTFKVTGLPGAATVIQTIVPFKEGQTKVPGVEFEVKYPEGGNTPEEVDALDSNDIKEIIGDVKKAAIAVNKVRQSWEKADKAKEALFKNGEKLVAAAEKLTEDDNSKKAGNSRALMESATQVSKVIDAPQMKIVPYILKSCTSLLDYCEHSIKARGGKEEAPKKAA